MTSIGWYTRDGDLDFLARVSIELKSAGVPVTSHYVCHTSSEEKRLNSEYNVRPWVLGEYLERNERTFRFSDKKLRELEEKYNSIPLRSLLWSEIYEKGYPEETLIYHLVAHFQFWENFLSENKIDVIVSEGPGILSTCVLWVVCQQMGILFAEFTPVGISGRKTFRSSWEDGIDDFQKELRTAVVKKDTNIYREALQYYEKMITNPEKPSYTGIDLNTGKKIAKNEAYQKFLGIPKVNQIVKTLRKMRAKKNDNNYYLKSSKFERYAAWLMSTLRMQLFGTLNVFERNVEHRKEKYFLFPLHILNEWCDYPWMGLKYPNMIELIKECADCLPLGTKLYVKEHPSLFPQKSIKHFLAIKRIRNVRLIDRNENTYALIRNSEGVITLGSTIGWEAFLIGKPVIILADVWYRHLPGIFKADTFFDLARLLQNVHRQPLPSKAEKIKVIYVLYSLSFVAKHYPIKDIISPANVKRCAKAFEAYLNNKINTKQSF